ncbi:MAG TPA: serine hydrolase domain-containing protein [Bryobacteraceae bacterium]|nr:serine hydrolase domain-containing protein [Bryobacteraceae bacterium]
MLRDLAAFMLLLPALHAADPFEGVRDSIRRQLAETSVPSVAVAVARDGRIVWEEGFGWADREKRIPATAHTMYSLASISKPFTATGLMVLVRRGAIVLDKPVNDYLGSAKVRARVGDAAQATVRRVANHTAGLPLHFQFFYRGEPNRPPSRDETILRFGNLVAAPGEGYSYSNLGYGILDHVIARASGRSFAEFMRTSVFFPLGLTRTSVDFGPELEDYAAVRYGSDGLPIPPYEFDHDGASAVWSSAHDLVRFAMFHLKAHLPEQKPILPDDLIDAMQNPTAAIGANSGYGVGWRVDDHPAGRIVSHSGGMPGVLTDLRMVPSEKLAVVVLSNASAGLPQRIADQIVSALLPAWKPSRNQPSAPNLPIPKQLLGSWKGHLSTYKAEIPLTVRILESGDVHAQLGTQLKMLWNDTRWDGVAIRGRMPGDLGIEECARGPRVLQFTLTPRGNVLNGPVSATSEMGRPRPAGAVTQWVELTRQ